MHNGKYAFLYIDFNFSGLSLNALISIGYKEEVTIIGIK
jgi:hypothetical protein